MKAAYALDNALQRAVEELDRFAADIAALRESLNKLRTEVDRGGGPVSTPTDKSAVVAPLRADKPVPVTPVPSGKPLTVEDVKAVIIATHKRVSGSHGIVQKIVMDHGGKEKNPDTGAEGPSLRALPADQYAAVVAALQALCE